MVGKLHSHLMFSNLSVARLTSHSSQKDPLHQIIHKSPPPVVFWTAYMALSRPVQDLSGDRTDEGPNSKSKAIPVELNDVELWVDFLTNREIQVMLEDEEVSSVLHGLLKIPQHLQIIAAAWSEPCLGGKVSEEAFTTQWAPQRSLLNEINRMCAAKIRGTPVPAYIEIGVGDCAKRKAPGRTDKELKRPDFAAYERVLARNREGKNQFNGLEPLFTDNRIPGDAKLFRKIRRTMLPPDGYEYTGGDSAVVIQAQRVITQIHDYMDRHGSRYGYVVNDEELIFFRRRGTGWGHIDVGPAIRHDVTADPEAGIFNSKWVLFYFHWIVANDRRQWHLPSCLPMVKQRRSSRKLPLDTTSKSIHVEMQIVIAEVEEDTSTMRKVIPGLKRQRDGILKPRTRGRPVMSIE